MASTHAETDQTTTRPLTHKEDPILYLSEVAAQVGRTTRTVSNWIDDGILKASRHPSGSGRVMGVRQSEVDALLRRIDEVEQAGS